MGIQYSMSQSAPQTLAVLTTVYKNYKVLDDFFSSLKKQSSDAFHVFVSDLSEDKRKKISLPPFATLTEGINKGYAHGINIGLVEAQKRNYKQFCVVNNDVIFPIDFVKNAQNSITKHKKTLIGGKIYYAPGFEFHNKRYKKEEKGKIIWYAGGDVDWDHALTHHRGVDEVDAGQYDKKEKTSFITGCLMCFDYRVLDVVGYWDESYFLYYEDADYCERAKKKEIPLVYDPAIRLWHKNAQSTDGSGSSLHEKYQRKNRLRYGLTYAPWRTKFHLAKNYILGS